ncbi:MAG: hypothetical protein LBF57_01595 [Holosporaceae bacterium]|jgi:hypothetical protein|nr:hypothetical protein [Holosporaceae bacterium]
MKKSLIGILVPGLIVGLIMAAAYLTGNWDTLVGMGIMIVNHFSEAIDQVKGMM